MKSVVRGQVMTRRPPATVFIIRLQATPDVAGIHELRRLLKILLRTFGLRCIAAREEQPDLFGGTS
jgi:hypothetical protein